MLMNDDYLKQAYGEASVNEFGNLFDFWSCFSLFSLIVSPLKSVPSFTVFTPQLAVFLLRMADMLLFLLKGYQIWRL